MAEQSRKPPEELLNSSLGGGSMTKLGPRKWASKGRALGDITSSGGHGWTQENIQITALSGWPWLLF